jgi:imidazolonepropionase-like amidohydrolase
MLPLAIIATVLFGCNSEHVANKEEITLDPFLPLNQAGQTPPTYKNLIVFDNVNVITMNEQEQILTDQRVVVANNKIIAIGNKTTIELGDAEQVIDGKNGYLLPGFIDSHMHITHEGSGNPNIQTFTDPAQMSIYLQQGVTTIRSYSGTPYNLEWRDKVDSGQWLGTRIVTSGPIFSHDQELEDAATAAGIKVDDIAESFLAKLYSTYPKDPDAAITEVSRQKQSGYNFLKVYSQLPEPIYLSVVEQAKTKNLFLAGHIPDAPLDIVFENQQEIAHILELMEHYSSFNGSWDEYQKWIISALLKNDISIIFNWSTDEVNMEMFQGIDVYSREGYWVIPDMILANWYNKPANEITPQQHERAKTFVKALVDSGVVVQVGSDTSDAGSLPEFIHRDMELMVEAGVSPYQALLASTRNPANIIAKITKQAKDRGEVTVGYFADLVLVKENPLDNISHTRNHHGVMVNGHWLTEKELTNMVSHFITLPVTPLLVELKE